MACGELTFSMFSVRGSALASPHVDSHFNLMSGPDDDDDDYDDVLSRCHGSL